MRRALVIFAIGSIGACSSLDDLSTGSDAGSNADGAATSDAGEAGGVGEVFSDHFESALDCDGWIPAYGNATPVGPGYMSMRSCRFCATGSSYFDKTVSVDGGGTFLFAAEVRSADTMPATQVSVLLYFDATAGRNSTGPVDATWQKVTVADTAPNATTVRVRFNAMSGTCTLIDDAVLKWQR